jgi:PAS domain S-box-containing protein
MRNTPVSSIPETFRPPLVTADVNLWSTFESIFDGVCTIDRNWLCQYANGRAFETLGHDSALVGGNVWKQLPFLNTAATGRALRTAMLTGEQLEIEDTFPDLGKWYTVNINPVPFGLVVFLRAVPKRKHDEAETARSERRFHGMFETLTQGVVFHDRNGAIVDSNPAASRILGIPADELRNAKSGELDLHLCNEKGAPLSPDEIPVVVALRTGKVVRDRVLSYRLRTTNEIRWLVVDAIPQFDANSSAPSHAFTLFNDITSQKRAEDALRESRAHLALAQQVASVGSAFLDFETGQLTWSDETYRIYGVDRDSSSPTLDELLDLIHPEDRHLFSNQIDTVRSGFSSDPIEFRIVKPNGEIRTIHRVSAAIRNDDGSVRALIATNSDVTERRQAEAVLLRSQTHLRLAQRVAAVGSTIIDRRSGDWDWSDETFLIFGVSKETFRPSLDSMLGLIHKDDRATFREAIDRTNNDVIPYPMEFRVIKPDGRERIFYHEMDFIRDESGETTGVIATSSDITDLRVTEKKHELLQNQLYHAQRLDSLGTLAGGIAHDLNNTLVPILGLSEALLASAATPDSQRPLLEVMHQAGVRGRDLVRQILAFSRQEKPETKPIDLTPLVQEAMRLARASIPATIAIEQRLEDAPPILGNSSQLIQVLLNLVANAAQAIGDNIGTITVELAQCGGGVRSEQSDGPDLSLRVSVIDNGCGMNEETQKRIFEPFFTTKAVGAGTGLGLSVVHGIISAHKGRIEVSSKPGAGSRFDVFLPAIDAGQDPLASA